MGKKSLSSIYQTNINIQNYRELKKLNTKRKNNPINQWANELTRQFSKEKV
jgi:hypothetical protein